MEEIYKYSGKQIFKEGIPVAVSLGKGSNRGNIPQHCHDFLELVFVAGGSMVHTLNFSSGRQVSYALVAGDVFAILPGESHFYSESCNVLYYNVMFDFNMLKGELEGMSSLESYKTLFARDMVRTKIHLAYHEKITLETQIRKIAGELSMQRPGYVQFVKGALLEVLITILRQRPVVLHGDSRYDYIGIAKCISCMENAPEKALSAKELASIAGISQSHLYVRFKEATGLSPNEYLLNLRLEKACSMLLERDCIIGEIALDCGFCDSNHFIESFRKRYNLTPGQFRRQFLILAK